MKKLRYLLIYTLLLCGITINVNAASASLSVNKSSVDNVAVAVTVPSSATVLV